MNSAAMLKQPQRHPISAAGLQGAPVEIAGPPPLGICVCLESLHNTVTRLSERTAELEMELSYVLPQATQTPPPAQLQGSGLPPNFPPAVAEILAIEARVIEVLARIERLTEDVAI
jgi:hypothetical protein